MSSSSAARVLDVGQCSPDHASIRALITSRFQAEVDRAMFLKDALAALRKNQYQLVLVNRVFDADGTEGLELIRQVRDDALLREVPIMLVSNYADAQSAAVAAGALPGFGKAQLFEPATLQCLEQHLPLKESARVARH